MYDGKSEAMIILQCMDIHYKEFEYMAKHIHAAMKQWQTSIKIYSYIDIIM